MRFIDRKNLKCPAACVFWGRFYDFVCHAQLKKERPPYFYSAHTLISASMNPVELKLNANILMKGLVFTVFYSIFMTG